MEFHNISTSNEEVIERLKLVINDNLEKKNTYLFSDDEKNKAINLATKLSLKNIRLNISCIDKSLDDLDNRLIDILCRRIELPLLKLVTLSEIFKTKNLKKLKRLEII